MNMLVVDRCREPPQGTYECSTAFSVVINSCSVRRSLFPPRTGNVELWAIFLAACLNILPEEFVGV